MSGNGRKEAQGMITAEILADSVWSKTRSPRLTTFLLHYPRIILAELNTHRVFGRSTESSRAIPVAKQVEKVLQSPYIPTLWGKNQRGMQSKEEIAESNAAILIWRDAAEDAARHAGHLADLQVHKQLANRLLEPFVFVHTVVTATEWANFFALRCHEDAHPDFQTLADLMLRLYVTNEPVETSRHRPFCDRNMDGITCDEDALVVGTARSARVSYASHDGQHSLAKDRVLVHHPETGLAPRGHWSPFEHCADALDPTEHRGLVNWYDYDIYERNHEFWSGHLRGWVPYRKRFPEENRRCDLRELARKRGLIE